MSFDYFYGPDDAEQYSFYRIPKKLITGDEFQEISTEAKLLYGLMLDRLQLSIRNQWFDALNRVYIIPSSHRRCSFRTSRARILTMCSVKPGRAFSRSCLN